jgi:hypothetical protein
MTKYELAIDEYGKGKFKTVIEIILDLLPKNEVNLESEEYANILLYLGSSRLEIFKSDKSNFLPIYEALTDFATAGNMLLINHRRISDSINQKIKECSFYINN